MVRIEGIPIVAARLRQAELLRKRNGAQRPGVYPRRPAHRMEDIGVGALTQRASTSGKRQTRMSPSC